MKMFKTSLLLTALFALTTAAHAQIVGRVLMAAGDTSVIRDSRELRVAVGFPVEGKDTLRTGPASNMQIRFTDESIVSMRDQSLLKIDEYQFTGKQDGLEKAFFNLLKGGFRTITGVIGRVNKTNYGVKTATATIGIRGTHFALLLCAASSCGAAAKDGLYGGVSGGIIAATNNTGEYQFGSGDYFYAPNQDTPVKKLIGPPGFFADQLAGQQRGGTRDASSTGTGSEQAQNGGAGSDSRPNNVTPPPPQQSFVVTENKTAGGAPVVISTTSGAPAVPGSFPTTGSGGITFYRAVLAGLSDGFDISQAQFTATSSGDMASFLTSSSPPSQGNIGGAAVLDSGSNLAAGNLHWGRWLGAGATVDGLLFGGDSTRTNSNLHYIIGDVTTLPGSGMFTYNPVGGTQPTNRLGTTGTFLGGNVLVDFLARQLSVNNLMIGFNSATYTMNSGLQPFLANGSFIGGLGGSCVGATCGTSVPFGAYAGSFTGANAPGLAMVYHVNDSSGPNGDLVGAQGFKR